METIKRMARKALGDQATNIWRCACGQKNRVDLVMATLEAKRVRCGKCGLPIPVGKP